MFYINISLMFFFPPPSNLCSKVLKSGVSCRKYKLLHDELRFGGL